MSVDPASGFAARPQSRNRYSYVQNQPINYRDETGAYRTDFHLDLTEVLAVAAGYSTAEARAIAQADQGMDSGDTSPFTSGTEGRAAFHFTTEARRADLLQTASSSGAAADIGAFLHALQDSFSHAGFTPEKGHWTTAPDITRNNPGKALMAAQSTFNALVSFRGGAAPVGFSDIKNFVHLYLIAKEGSEIRKHLLTQIRVKVLKARQRQAAAEQALGTLEAGGCAYHGICQ
jgi:hypothetical protein